MSKVVLHIGTHKTATTTIQDMFWANADLLAQKGLIYPKLGRVTGHHGLVFDWGHLPKVYAYEEGSLAALRRIAQDYAQTEATVFLSSEEFSRTDPRGAPDFEAIRAALSPFDEIEVICVLRTQWQFLQSVYLELSKKSNPQRPPHLVLPVIESGMYAGLSVDYNTILDRLETVFRPEEITFMDFATCRNAPGGIIGTMLRHLNVDLNPDDLEKVNGGTSNVSPPSLASFAANILAEPKVAQDWLLTHTTEAMRIEFGDDCVPCLFARGEFEALKDHFGARNEVLRTRRAPIQPDFAVTPAEMDGLTLFRNELTASYWIRVAHRMALDRL
ncbi:hypothetical protein CKO11_13910 [Rhodobacter sp. TJ_12]|uniref:hypothetical protein n=1 Tax=Rhodobacter sp. TJ_12 TaxID=2029399 RepID=UPI001CC0889A|nr:hypothetical protein [Rhodobacter sp. TJ_12]MBZ4023553.1 hypothetical protein [Rhodobacter sp. TJ_12]